MLTKKNGGETVSEELLIRHCSPTLAGIKTGNLFPVNLGSENELKACVREWNKSLSHKGLRIMPMRFENGRALIYVYRPSHLSKDLSESMAEDILSSLGYSGKTPERCIGELMKRMRQSEDFPHEIGLFLGYPPEDVKGFIENKACGSKCTGCWKVYGDENAAKKIFARYKKCTAIYSKLFADGRSLEKLTVAA